MLSWDLDGRRQAVHQRGGRLVAPVEALVPAHHRGICREGDFAVLFEMEGFLFAAGAARRSAAVLCQGRGRSFTVRACSRWCTGCPSFRHVVFGGWPRRTTNEAFRISIGARQWWRPSGGRPANWGDWSHHRDCAGSAPATFPGGRRTGRSCSAVPGKAPNGRPGSGIKPEDEVVTSVSSSMNWRRNCGKLWRHSVLAAAPYPWAPPSRSRSANIFKAVAT